MTGNIVHLDGTRIFQSSDDMRAERSIADEIQAKWKCELHSFGSLAPVDWYAVRYGRMVGVLELKRQSKPFGTYPTVMLSIRKWLCLTLASTAFNVPAIFVVAYSDALCWVGLTDVDASAVHMTGNRQRNGQGGNDYEPIILVPTTKLRLINQPIRPQP